MRILLDENIPLQLYRQLTDAGHDVEHIITSDRRGLPDSEIRRRLTTEDDLVLLTQDTEFLDLPPFAGRTIVSRVPQRLPIARRVELWSGALERFLRDRPSGQLFEMLPTGEVVEWKTI